MRIPRQLFFLVIALAATLSTSASMTFAQSSDEEIEEIVIIGTKRATSLQDVPLAVSVVDAQIVERS